MSDVWAAIAAERGALANDLADLTPAHMLVRMQVISDRRDPQATLSTLRSWVVEDGKTGALES